MIRVKKPHEIGSDTGHSTSIDIFAKVKTLVKDPVQRLSFLFGLIALHSFLVGVGLVLHPPELIRMAGFQPVTEGFFPVQGGVFHILMSIFYLTVTLRKEGYRLLVHLSILVKSGAFGFLLVYYLWVSPIFAVLMSGIGDGAMAAVMIWAYLSAKQHEPADNPPKKEE